MKTQKTILAASLLTILLSQGAQAAVVDSDQDGIPDTAEALIQTDPLNADTDGDGIKDLDDKEPTVAPISVVTSGPKSPIEIKEALVEDNYDYAAKHDAPDHLELLLKNSSSKNLTDLSVSYSITSNDSGKHESYIVPLKGFQLAAGAEERVHLDDAKIAGHFRANPNSIYKTDSSAKTFKVIVDAAGYQSVTVEINKDKGGAEQAD
jgi:hypothetical protein